VSAGQGATGAIWIAWRYGAADAVLLASWSVAAL
jgi:hypothetical protein